MNIMGLQWNSAMLYNTLDFIFFFFNVFFVVHFIVKVNLYSISITQMTICPYNFSNKKVLLITLTIIPLQNNIPYSMEWELNLEESYTLLPTSKAIFLDLILGNSIWSHETKSLFTRSKKNFFLNRKGFFVNYFETLWATTNILISFDKKNHK